MGCGNSTNGDDSSNKKKKSDPSGKKGSGGEKESSKEQLVTNNNNDNRGSPAQGRSVTPSARAKEGVSQFVNMFTQLTTALDDVADGFYGELSACLLGKTNPSTGEKSTIPEDTIDFASNRLKKFCTKYSSWLKDNEASLGQLAAGKKAFLVKEILPCYDEESLIKFWRGVNYLVLCVDVITVGYVVSARQQLSEAEAGDRTFTDLSDGVPSEEDEDLVKLHGKFISTVVDAVQQIIGEGIPDEFAWVVAATPASLKKETTAVGRRGSVTRGSVADTSAAKNSSAISKYYLESQSLTTLVSLIMLEVLRPSAGMHTVSSIREEVKALNALLGTCGFLTEVGRAWLQQQKRRAENSDEDSDRNNKSNSNNNKASAALKVHAPVCLLGPAGRKAMLYMESAVGGQKKLSIHTVIRSDVLQSTWKMINGFDEANTFKLFPTFINSSSGIERGEGHGPRKEYFDITAKELTATYSDPVDISDCMLAVGLGTNNPVTGGAQEDAAPHQISLRKKKSTLTFGWKNREAAEYAAIVQGMDIEVRCLAAGGDTGGTGGINSSARLMIGDEGKTTAVVCRRSVIRSTYNPSDNTTTIELSGALEGDMLEDVEVGGFNNDRPPSAAGDRPEAATEFTVELVDIELLTFSVLRNVTPLFSASADVTDFCWINPSLPDVDGSRNSSVETTSDFLQKFRAVGTILANAVANGVEVPCTLPPLLFKLFTLHSPREELLRWECTPEDIALLSSKSSAGGSGGLEEDPEFASILEMGSEEFEAFLEMEDLEGLSDKERKKLTPLKFITNFLIPSRVFPGPGSSSKEYLAALVEGFQKSKIHQLGAFSAATPQLRRHIFCGLRDDGVSDFQFSNFFRFHLGDDMTATPHGKKFKAIFFDLIEHEFEAPEKRLLLQFITGRTLLPSNRGEETINVEFPYTCMGAKDFARSRNHLPASHSCDNVMDLPNYLECIMFEPSSSWYQSTGTKVGAMIGESTKRKAWSALSDDVQADFLSQAKYTLREKLLLAVQDSSGYELDEGIAALKENGNATLTGVELLSGTQSKSAVLLPRLASSGGGTGFSSGNKSSSDSSSFLSGGKDHQDSLAFKDNSLVATPAKSWQNIARSPRPGTGQQAGGHISRGRLNSNPSSNRSGSGDGFPAGTSPRLGYSPKTAQSAALNTSGESHADSFQTNSRPGSSQAAPTSSGFGAASPPRPPSQQRPAGLPPMPPSSHMGNYSARGNSSGGSGFAASGSPHAGAYGNTGIRDSRGFSSGTPGSDTSASVRSDAPAAGLHQPQKKPGHVSADLDELLDEFNFGAPQ